MFERQCGFTELAIVTESDSQQQTISERSVLATVRSKREITLT